MNVLKLNLPPGAQQVGQLRRDFDVDELDQDILQVRLATGFFIDVGWAPEYDANGSFQIQVFRGSWENQELGPITASTVQDVKSSVEQLAEQYSKIEAPRYSSGSARA